MTTPQASDTLSTLNGSLIKMMDWNREKFEEIFRKAHEEQLRFVNQRLERNARMLEDFRDCQGLPGMIAAEQKWLVDTARDYFEEMERFSGIVRDFAERGTREASEKMQAATSDFRSAAKSDAQKIQNAERRAAAE